MADGCSPWVENEIEYLRLFEDTAQFSSLSSSTKISLSLSLLGSVMVMS